MLEDKDLPEGLKNLIMLCRDADAKIYFFDRLQKMPEPVQREIDKAAQLMIEMAEALDEVYGNTAMYPKVNFALKKFKEWK